MVVSKTDEQGRIYLPKEIRDRYGERFRIVKAVNEIILVPVPQEPIKELRNVSKNLRGKSIKELKRKIAEEALKEA